VCDALDDGVVCGDDDRVPVRLLEDAVRREDDDRVEEQDKLAMRKVPAPGDKKRTSRDVRVRLFVTKQYVSFAPLVVSMTRVPLPAGWMRVPDPSPRSTVFRALLRTAGVASCTPRFIVRLSSSVRIWEYTSSCGIGCGCGCC
jgi:hypothetical protein